MVAKKIDWTINIFCNDTKFVFLLNFTGLRNLISACFKKRHSKKIIINFLPFISSR